MLSSIHPCKAVARSFTASFRATTIFSLPCRAITVVRHSFSMAPSIRMAAWVAPTVASMRPLNSAAQLPVVRVLGLSTPPPARVHFRSRSRATLPKRHCRGAFIAPSSLTPSVFKLHHCIFLFPVWQFAKNRRILPFNYIWQGEYDYLIRRCYNL